MASVYQQESGFPPCSSPHTHSQRHILPLLRAATTLALARVLALFSGLSLKIPKPTYCPQCNLQSAPLPHPPHPPPASNAVRTSPPHPTPQSGFISYYFFMGISLVTACPPLPPLVTSPRQDWFPLLIPNDPIKCARPKQHFSQKPSLNSHGIYLFIAWAPDFVWNDTSPVLL